MMEQNYPEEVDTTSSDFETFVNESTPTKDSEKVDVQSVLADAEKMKDFITCVKCKQVFDHDSHKPFLLPCLDAICKSCIREISALESQSYSCCKCQCDHICFQHGEILLIIDNTRQIISEINRLNNVESGKACGMCETNQTAVRCCFDCSVFICADCYNLHRTLRPLRSHSVVELKSFTEKMKNFKLFHTIKYCPVAGHEKEILKMHCLHPSCMKTVCILCAISSHKDHNLCDITEIGKQSETKLETHLSKIDLKIKQARNLFDELTDIDEKFQKDSDQLQKEIKTMFSHARLALEQKEKNFCESVVTRLVEKQTNIENDKKEIISFINSCEHASLYSNVSSEINDYMNFIDIAKIIQLRFENLQLCVPENKVTVDTMIFSSELSDCLGTPINSLGKLSVTSVDSSKSYVVVTVAEYNVKQEIQFEMHLLSSTGNCIHDEDVRVSLRLADIFFKDINCAFNATSCTFFGSFVPDKPMTLFWSVVSNDVQHQTLSGVINMKETDKSIVVDPMTTNVNFMTCIPMSKRDYLAVLNLGNQYSWFKSIVNKVKYTNGSLCLDIDADGTAKENIMKLLASIRIMCSDIILIRYEEIDVQKRMQQIEEMKLGVCLIWNDSDIEVISDSYEDILRANQIFSVKSTGRRRLRTFQKSEETDEEKNQNIKSNWNSISLIRSKGLSLVNVKTKEGLIIKVYVGIITHLNVDCIANAANERLKHCGGEAALISEAAGFQFDRECREYVKDHGPIPVRSYFVSSAGKLHYKCVINTVGPRWDDYFNKNQCLKDLHDSIHVTFMEADKMGMKSLAIPSMGSGVFAVPRKICVQQYYKAVMSFSRSYPFKSLQEIHFVDWDESMVLAIQEIFQRREDLQ